MDDGFLHSLERISASAKMKNSMLNSGELSFILNTASTWKNGIEDFTLILRKESANTLISLCFPGKIKRLTSITII